ncbi:DUF3179 domain-containing protein [Jejuia spongiicola]|uniref:DUF3179 domain-containing protein n=1 Tax=Jejuia spongiicola TaxID=2942207 RepID=A0ABT0QED5_9FLAO|nr:DUF3179 domain-containing protein [Jejuia spongiicola]MCL6295333.1 DUF3179 domain-containing protein [Jejuia spongiicola]
MKKNIIYALVIIITIACSTSQEGTTLSENGNNEAGNWSIPIAEVKDGGPGKDGIPSIDNPKFLNINQIDFLSDDDLIVGIVNGNVVRAYPHPILDWHEVLNDEVNGEFVTINYCPLTGTAFGWKSKVNDTKTTFGVSGLLYNANLILYDRNTGSNWSQMKLECVNGQLIGDRPELVNIIETNWKTWKALYPNSEVLSTDTGFSRNYNNYPYGPYRTSNTYFIFQPAIFNDALPNKERVYAIIDKNESKIYQFTSFENGNVIKDSFNSIEHLVVGNQNLIKAFKLSGEYANLTFSYDFNDSESFFKDNEGNKWSVFGEAIEGPRTGEKLTAVKSVVSYWFAIATFYPDPEIYNP